MSSFSVVMLYIIVGVVVLEMKAFCLFSETVFSPPVCKWEHFALMYIQLYYILFLRHWTELSKQWGSIYVFFAPVCGLFLEIILKSDFIITLLEMNRILFWISWNLYWWLTCLLGYLITNILKMDSTFVFGK